MKAKEIAKNAQGQLDKHYQIKELEKRIKEYAKQKCKVQDRNTRHKCIEDILELYSEIDGECSQYFVDLVHGKLMNTNAPEPNFE